MISRWSFECEESKIPGALHHWVRKADGTAYCRFCKMKLTKEEAEECFTQR